MAACSWRSWGCLARLMEGTGVWEHNERGSVACRGWNLSVWAWPLLEKLRLSWAVPGSRLCGEDLRQALSCSPCSSACPILCSSWGTPLPAGEEAEDFFAGPRPWQVLAYSPWHGPTWLSPIAPRSRVSPGCPAKAEMSQTLLGCSSSHLPGSLGDSQLGTGGLAPCARAVLLPVLGRHILHERGPGWMAEKARAAGGECPWREMSVLPDLCMSYLSILPDLCYEEL